MSWAHGCGLVGVDGCGRVLDRCWGGTDIKGSDRQWPGWKARYETDLRGGFAAYNDAGTLA